MTALTELNKVEAELAAEMRLAFTRATVNFPKSLNTTPIAIAVNHVFADVFYELKRLQRWSVRREYSPLNEDLLFHISGLVDRARDELQMKGVPMQVTVGMPIKEMRSFSALVSGLDVQSARTLVRFAREHTGDKQEIMRQRSLLLLVRRNKLANDLTGDAMRVARSYFLSEVPSA